MLRPILALAAVTVGMPVWGANFTATLAHPVTERIIARDIVWSCGVDACQCASDESRPAVLCQSLAKRSGVVDSFTVDGRAFTAAELDRCNAFAKSEPKPGLAAK